MTLRVISAEAVIFDGEVKSVSLPGTLGAFQVLRNHASLISTLTAGSVRYVDPSGEEHSAEISGGLVDIDSNVVSVCVY
ncbi:MAG: F0F1 ATP synthase subunit epsilon [Muribaculaceae bacterium]|nr:F0F1 ATP synthase subunit epsilon [Muribaculaceae bacterium]